MAKHYGNDRKITPRQKAMNEARDEYRTFLRNDYISEEQSFFNEKNGCFTLVFKGHNPHKEEIEAAEIFNKEGYDIQLRPEGDYPYSISLRLSKKRHKTYVDGLILDQYAFEQSSPISQKDAVYKGLKHTREKGAEVCVIFDKYINIHKENVVEGIVHFKRVYNDRKEKFVKTLLIVDFKNQNIHEWGI